MNTKSTDIYEVKTSIAELKEKKEVWIMQKRECENRLNNLSVRVRTGGRLPDKEYKRICREQKKTKEKILSIEKELMPINRELRQWYAMEDEIRANVSMNMPMPVINDTDITGKLRSLRDKYLAFSEDHTRINSMRLMASGFASELTDILKSA